MTSLVHSRQSFFDLRPKDTVLVDNIPYIVDRQVRGGMGCIYLLWQDSKNSSGKMSALGLKLALKAIIPDAVDSDSVALFKRELTVWSGFRHQNIIWLLKIIDAGDAGWVAAMDWCTGSLRDILKQNGKLSIKDSANIIGSILEGLAYAYEKDRVLHLDVKPENILYTFDFGCSSEKNQDRECAFNQYRFMVSDWGIASIKQPQLSSIAGMPATSPELQRTFNNMGTLLYMAPERFKKGVSSSVASDIFSLGMIYLELLVGHLPFRAEMHPIHSLISGQYIKDARMLLQNHQIPSPITNTILDMIAYLPSQRLQDYTTVRSSIIRAWRKSNGFFYKLFN